MVCLFFLHVIRTFLGVYHYSRCFSLFRPLLLSTLPTLNHLNRPFGRESSTVNLFLNFPLSFPECVYVSTNKFYFPVGHVSGSPSSTDSPTHSPLPTLVSSSFPRSSTVRNPSTIPETEKRVTSPSLSFQWTNNSILNLWNCRWATIISQVTENHVHASRRHVGSGAKGDSCEDRGVL